MCCHRTSQPGFALTSNQTSCCAAICPSCYVRLLSAACLTVLYKKKTHLFLQSPLAGFQLPDVRCACDTEQVMNNNDTNDMIINILLLLLLFVYYIVMMLNRP